MILVRGHDSDPVVQLERALVYGTRRCRFESYRDHGWARSGGEFSGQMYPPHPAYIVSASLRSD